MQEPITLRLGTDSQSQKKSAAASKNLTKIDRMNGYLSYSRVHGESRLNDAKMAEIAERKSM